MLGRTILFDTGSNGRVLLKNMTALGLLTEPIDLIFLSHPHWDHMGGLDSLLELHPGATVALHEGFSRHFMEDVRLFCQELVVVGADPRKLAPGVFSTGMFGGRPPEHALVLVAGDAAAVVTGCAHPGVERIVERTAGFLGRNVDGAIGGFHLCSADTEAINQTVRSLRGLGMSWVAPTHCAGDPARAALRREYKEKCLEAGGGREIRIGVAP